MIPPVGNIHTHAPEARDAIINLEPGMAMRADGLYSAGWHPWWPGFDAAWVERMAADPRVRLIGECGVDKMRGVATPARQLEILRFHALLAERSGRPLLLHVVGAWQEVVGLRRELQPAVEWIVHGFRGKPELARQLVAAGFHVSLGLRFNPAVLAAIPPGRLLRETD